MHNHTVDTTLTAVDRASASVKGARRLAELERQTVEALADRYGVPLETLTRGRPSFNVGSVPGGLPARTPMYVAVRNA